MPGQPNRRDQSKRAENQRKYAELKALRDQWVQQGLVQHGIAPEAALQRVIDDSVFRYLEECERNDRARAEGRTVSDRRERGLAREMASYAQMAMQYNLEDRRVSADERRTAAMGAILQVVAARMGLGPDEIRKVPGLMGGVARELRDVPAHEHEAFVRRELSRSTEA
jgi:hypothetical protein